VARLEIKVAKLSMSRGAQAENDKNCDVKIVMRHCCEVILFSFKGEQVRQFRGDQKVLDKVGQPLTDAYDPPENK